MGKTKDKLDGLRVVRTCWTRPMEETVGGTKADCYLSKCPYAEKGDCDVSAMLDAIDLAEQLYRKLKRTKRKDGNHDVDTHQ